MPGVIREAARVPLDVASEPTSRYQDELPRIKTADEELKHACGISPERRFFASDVEDITAAILENASDEQLYAAIGQWEVELRKLRKEQTSRRLQKAQ